MGAASDIQNTTVVNQKSWLKTAVLIQLLFLLLLIGVQYRHVISGLITRWNTDSDWSHGYIIPFFGLYFLYMQRDRLPWKLIGRFGFSHWIGIGLLVLSFLLYVGSTFYQFGYPKQLSLLTMIAGGVMAIWGWPMARWSWFAIAFLVFAIPVPHRLYNEMTLPLREVAASTSATILTFVPEMQAEAQGTVVEYFYQGRRDILDIERACSGMRLLMTMMALGVAMAFMHERALWQRLVMVIACVPIAIFCNILRVTTTGFLVVFGQKDLAEGTPHTLLGMGMLLIAFGLYGLISYSMTHLFVEEDEGHRSEPAVVPAGGER